MLGWVCYEEEKRKERECLLIGGAAVLRVFVPRGRGSRCALSARRAARFLARSGVRLAALPPDYPYAAAFLRAGIALPDAAVLYRACAAKIVRCALRQCGISPQTASVALLAEKPSTALARAAHELSHSVRYLTLCVPNGEELARALRWQYGAAVRLVGEAEEVSAALAVSFDGTPAVPCPHLPLEDGRFSVSLQAQIGGAEYTDLSLLAAMKAADALTADEICVNRVIFPSLPNFA